MKFDLGDKKFRAVLHNFVEQSVGSSIEIGGTDFDLEFVWSIESNKYNSLCSHIINIQIYYDLEINFTLSSQLLIKLMEESGVLKFNRYFIFTKFKAIVDQIDFVKKFKYHPSLSTSMGKTPYNPMKFRIYGVMQSYEALYPLAYSTSSDGIYVLANTSSTKNWSITALA